MAIYRFIIIVTISIFLQNAGFCQNKWIQSYLGNKSVFGEDLEESYDKGYLLAGYYVTATFPNFSWIIKTDINGEMLWNKTFGETNSFMAIADIDINNFGEIFCVGFTTYYDPFQDPIIIKLNPCGEKQWCRVYHTPGDMDYAYNVLALEDGSVVTILKYTGYFPPGNDRICLAKFDSQGDMIWKECYNSPDTSMINEDARSFILTSDSGYLITGSCDYEDPLNPGLYWAKPYFIKTDSNGVFQWERVAFNNIGGESGGFAWTTTLNGRNDYYYSSISHHSSITGNYSPALIKMNLDGYIIDTYDLVYGYKHGGLGYSTFLNDSVLAGSAGWGNTEDDIVNHAVLFDTIGNIINNTNLVNDIYGSILQKSFDQKLLYMFSTYQSNQFDVYLRKLNLNLEDDTLYTHPFVYDSLCPYPIASDTIVPDDCGLIVGTTEWPAINTTTSTTNDALEVFPNPAREILNCQLLSEAKSRLVGIDCRLSIWLYDVWGRLIESLDLPPNQSQTQIDVSDYPPGVYFVVLKDGKVVLGRKKVVVH